jgi:hypothetical protein
MAKKPLRSQLNQIRAWVRQGRTDAWIAHQLDVSASELREFRRRHELSAEDDDTGEVELRDEIEAEIEALSEVAEEEEEVEEEAEAEEADEAEEGDEKREGEGSGRRRRRRRRRGRGGGGGDRAGASTQATFDHGDTDGYGLWLDPSVSDDPVYSEHWAGHRKVEVTIEADRIVIKRV